MSKRRSGLAITQGNQNTPILPKELEHHDAFRGYNSGCCGRLVGSLAVVSIFVSDPVSSWNAYDRAKYKFEVNEACDFLLNNGGREAGLAIKEQVFFDAALPYSEQRSKYKQNVKDVLNHLGFDSFMSFRASIFQTYPNIDTVAVFFVFNKDNRSFALSVRGHKTMRSTRRSDFSVGEYSVLYAKSHGKMVYTISHELLHLYGAIDYYYPVTTSQSAKLYAPHSIMLCSHESPVIDDLTQYLIGWNPDLSHLSQCFLKRIQGLRSQHSLFEKTDPVC